jgi:hypothetical protein
LLGTRFDFQDQNKNLYYWLLKNQTRPGFPVFDGTRTILNYILKNRNQRFFIKVKNHPTLVGLWVSAGPVNQDTKYPNNVDKIQKVCVWDLGQVGQVGRGCRGAGGMKPKVSRATLLVRRI